MTAALIMAGGSGTRMAAEIPKQFLEVEEEKMLLKTMRIFACRDEVDVLVLVMPAGWEDYITADEIADAACGKEVRMAEGGTLRTDSVYAGLLVCPDATNVLIQDAARPYVDEDTLTRIFAALAEQEAVVCGVTPKDTIKQVDEKGFVYQTLPRDFLRQIQTPQAFRYELIREAYDLLQGTDMTDITDDAMVVERTALAEVFVVDGSYENTKITTPDDLA